MTEAHRGPTEARPRSPRPGPGAPLIQGPRSGTPPPDVDLTIAGPRSRDRCDKCGSVVGEHVRVITASGSTQLRWRCDSCGRITTRSVKHAGRNLEGYPIARDDRYERPPCERCGSVGTEYHHWAPWALFEDAWDWPGDYLCLECHRRWHAVTRTNGRPELARRNPRSAEEER